MSGILSGLRVETGEQRAEREREELVQQLGAETFLVALSKLNAPQHKKDFVTRFVNEVIEDHRNFIVEYIDDWPIGEFQILAREMEETTRLSAMLNKIRGLRDGNLAKAKEKRHALSQQKIETLRQALEKYFQDNPTHKNKHAWRHFVHVERNMFGYNSEDHLRKQIDRLRKNRL